MSILMPYPLIFEEQSGNETLTVTFRDHPNIPPDSYAFYEYFCPDPECDCNMVMLGVVTEKLNKQVAMLVYLFDPEDVEPGQPNPCMDYTFQAPYSEHLRDWLAGYLQEDPSYLERLKRHYRQVREAASDPAHPAHSIYLEWESGIPSKDDLPSEMQELLEPQAKKIKAKKHTTSVPRTMLTRYKEITTLTERFCHELLNDEYNDLCLNLAAALARKRPSPLSGGKAEVWAAGIIYTLGQVNFLFDKSQTPHVRADEICEWFDVSQGSASGKARQIRQMLRIGVMDPAWCLPSLLDDNPFAWMITVNGFSIDARYAPPEIQEEAYRKGFIPYIPGRQ